MKVIPEVLSALNTLLSFSHMEVETPNPMWSRDRGLVLASCSGKEDNEVLKS